MEGDAPDLEVVGELPRELNGTFYQNGPNPAFEPRGRYHWFDGDGMIHAIQLRDGRASYRNRWVQSAGLAEERAAGHATFEGILGMKPTRCRASRTGQHDIVCTPKLLAPWRRAADLAPCLHARDARRMGLRRPRHAHDRARRWTRRPAMLFGTRSRYLTYHVADPERRARQAADRPLAIDDPRLRGDRGARDLHPVPVSSASRT
jgi:hypothetical protein